MKQEFDNTELKDIGLFVNTIFSFLSNYGNFFFSIVITFMMARLLSKYDWGILILSQSIISIWIITANFFPPGLNYSLSYYVPKFIALGEDVYLKSIIFSSIKQKLLALIPFFIIGILLINVFSFGYWDNLLIIYILSPQIIFQSLNNIFTSICFGYKLFKALFIIEIIKNSFHIGTLMGLFYLDEVNIILISFILTINSFIYLICKIIILWKKLRVLYLKGDIFKKNKNFNKILKYGIPTFISGQIGSLWIEVKKQSFGILLGPSMTTIYNIGESISLIPLTGSLAFHQPIISHFSGLNHEKEKHNIEMQFILIFKFSLIFICLISGVLIFLTEFYILFIYGNTYLLYILYFQLILISSVPRVLGGLLSSLLLSKNKVKVLPFITTIYLFVIIILFYFGIFYFQLYGYAYAIILASFINFIIQFKLTKILGDIKLPIKKTILIIVFFFDSLFISMILIYQILPRLYYLNTIIYTIIGACIFLILFLIQIILSKVIGRKELELFESFFKKDNRTNKFILKSIKILKKCIH